MDTKNFLTSAGGIAISLAVLFGTIWVVGKAWKSSQQ